MIFSARLSSDGSLISSFGSPESVNKVTKPSSAISISENSTLVTYGTSMLLPVPHDDSYFLPVKRSIPVMVALAAPCLPGLAVL